jgi:hypothetical protein
MTVTLNETIVGIGVYGHASELVSGRLALRLTVARYLQTLIEVRDQ